MALKLCLLGLLLALFTCLTQLRAEEIVINLAPEARPFVLSAAIENGYELRQIRKYTIKIHVQELDENYFQFLQTIFKDKKVRRVYRRGQKSSSAVRLKTLATSDSAAVSSLIGRLENLGAQVSKIGGTELEGVYLDVSLPGENSQRFAVEFQMLSSRNGIEVIPLLPVRTNSCIHFFK